MKKVKIALISVFCLVTLVGCSSPKSDMYVEDGAYNLSAQEYIDRINEVVAQQNDSRYMEIPAFEESGETIDIDFIYMELEISTDDNGKITELYYTWDATRDGIGQSIGLYIGYTSEMLGIDSDTVYDELDMMDTSSAGYETSYCEADTLFAYRTIGYGRFNYLTIKPSDSPAE